MLRTADRLLATCVLVGVGAGVAACSSSAHTGARVPQSVVDQFPLPTNWKIAQSGTSGGRAWRLLRGTDKGNVCYRFATTPHLPSPPTVSCDRAASLSGADGSSPMALELAEDGHGSGYIYGGIAPEVRTVTMHLRDGSRVALQTVDRTLVSNVPRSREVVKLSFAVAGSSGDCVTGTRAATFNCSWSGP